MQFCDEVIQLADKNKANFVSMKYIDNDGFIKQIDSSLAAYKENNFNIGNNSIKLKALPGKIFLDPFRSHPTITVFCENIAKKNSRFVATEIMEISNNNFKAKISAKISFWINEEEIAYNKNYHFAAKSYEKLLEKEETTESKVDLATIYGRIGKFRKEAQVYEDISNVGNVTPELQESIKRNFLLVCVFHIHMNITSHVLLFF